jgi:hypothetical protein
MLKENLSELQQVDDGNFLELLRILQLWVISILVFRLKISNNDFALVICFSGLILI